MQGCGKMRPPFRRFLEWPLIAYGNLVLSSLRFKFWLICLLSPHHCTGTKQSKGACMTYFGKSALLWSFLNRDASLEKNSLMGWPFCQQKCYLTWLRGAEEGQRRASIGHLEVLTNFGWARGARCTKEAEQEHIRWTTHNTSNLQRRRLKLAVVN